MSLIESLLNPIHTAHGWSPVQKAVGELSEYSTVDPYIGSVGVGPDTSVDSYLATYEIVPYVYRSVFVISSYIAQLPVLIEEKRGDEWVDVSDNPEFELFKTYNDSQTHYEFWEQTLGYLSLTGECPWILRRTASGKIIEMYPFSPEYLDIVPLNDFQVDHYYFASGADRIRLEAEDIFFLKYFNPQNVVRGLSPLSAAANDIALDLNAVSANTGMFKNGAKPSGLISTKEEMDDPTWERTRTYLKKEHEGTDKAGKIMFLTNGLQWQQMSVSNHDLQYMDQRKWSRKTVGMVMGVPDVFLMDFSDASVLANADIQYKLLWDTLKPITVKLAQVFTEKLIPQITSRPNIRFKFDLSGVAALQPDLKELGERYRQGFEMAAASPNDYRVNVLKLEADPDPLMDLKYIGSTMVPLGSAGVTTPAAAAAAEKKSFTIEGRVRALGETISGLLPFTTKLDEIDRAGEFLKQEHDRAKQMIYRSAAESIISQTISKVEGPFSKALEKLFDAQAKEVLANLSANKGIALTKALQYCNIVVKPNPEYRSTDKKCDVVDYATIPDPWIGYKFTATGVNFDYDQWVKEFDDAGMPHISESIRMGGAAFSASIGEVFNLADKETSAYIRARSYEYAAMVNDTTAARINQLVAQGVESELTVEQMAVTLTKYFEANKLMRATRIARTETVNGTNAGRVHAMKQSKRVEKHMWISQRDKDVRELHAQMDGTTVDVGDSFPGNDGFESAWPSSPNERCSTLPVRVDPKKN